MDFLEQPASSGSSLKTMKKRVVVVLKEIIKTPLLRNFMFLSLLIVLVYPVYFQYDFVPSFSEYMLEHKEEDAIISAKYISSTLFKEADIISEDLFTPDLVRKIQLIKQTYGMKKIRVLSKAGEIVFSTDPIEIGRINQNEYFFEIVNRGKTFSKIVVQDQSPSEGRTDYTDVVETYVPISTNSGFKGAFEIYYDVTGKNRKFGSLITRSLLVLFVFATILLIALMVVMVKVSMVLIKNRQAEEKIVKNNDFLKNVISSISYPFYVIDANSHIIKLANKASGFDPHKFGKSTCHSLAHHSSVPCDGLNHTCPIDRVKETRRPVVVEHHHVNTEGAERLIEVTAFPVFDEKNDVTAIIESNVDITEQRNTVENLRKSEEKYKSLIVSAPEPMIVTKDESIVFANSAALKVFEYSEEESYEMTIFDIISKHDKEEARIRYQNRLIGEADPSFDVRMVTKNQRTIWAEATAVEIEWEGNPAFLYFMVDRTKRKQIEIALQESHSRLEREVDERTNDYKLAKEEAERANRLKSEFLVNMSHELRTPMHHILSYAHMGSNYESMKDKMSACFDKITSAGNDMMTLVNNLLDLSNLQVDKMQYVFSKNDILLIINESVTRFKQQLETKEITISIDQPSVPTTVYCDKTLISQVVQNLLSNSIKFSEKRRHITVSTDVTEIQIEGLSAGNSSVSTLTVSIKDEGPGIPDNELSFIFDLFAQSSKTRTGAGGTGLGLAICHEIIKGHHGRIWAENNPESGATFSFLLPYEQKSK